MAQTAIASDFDKSLYVKRDGTATVTLNLKVVVDIFTQFGNIVLG